MRLDKHLFITTAGLALAAGLMGCTDGPELGSVTGTVAMNGQPVPFAYVLFQPINPPGTYASAYTDAQGAYELQFSPSSNGATIGKHQVTIRTSSKDEIEVEDKATGKMVLPPLPPGYQGRLEITFERQVEPGDNLHDFDITGAARSASSPRTARTR